MMRVRVLPLPEQTIGDTTGRPFVLVVDRVRAPSVNDFVMMRDEWETVKAEVGASLVLFSSESIELDATALEADPAIVDRLVALAGA